MRVGFGALVRVAPPGLLLVRLSGAGPRLPDPFGGCREAEGAVTRRAAGTRHQVAGLLRRGPGALAPSTRSAPATRRTRPPPGSEGKTARGPRERTGRSSPLGAPGPTDQEDEDLPHRGRPGHRADPPSRQGRPQRETDQGSQARRTTVAPDNASPTTPRPRPPPTPPPPGPTGHHQNQHHQPPSAPTPENTPTTHTTNHTHDPEHPPTTQPHTNLI